MTGTENATGWSGAAETWFGWVPRLFENGPAIRHDTHPAFDRDPARSGSVATRLAPTAQVPSGLHIVPSKRGRTLLRLASNRARARVVLRRRAVKPLVQLLGHRLEAVVAEGTFPHNGNAPSNGEQLDAVPRVASDVRLELGRPERLPARGRRRVPAAGVPVPEASVHEARGMEAREDDVRLSG